MFALLLLLWGGVLLLDRIIGLFALLLELEEFWLVGGGMLSEFGLLLLILVIRLLIAFVVVYGRGLVLLLLLFIF